MANIVDAKVCSVSFSIYSDAEVNKPKQTQTQTQHTHTQNKNLTTPPKKKDQSVERETHSEVPCT